MLLKALGYDRRTLLLLFGCVALTSVLLLRPGRIVSPDSFAYLSAAESLAKHGSFTLYDGSPLRLWPPLLPILLAPAQLMGMYMITWALMLYAVLMGFLAIAVYGIVYEMTQDARWSLGTAVAVVLWKPVLLNFLHLWSEPVLVVFASFALLGYLRWQRHHRRSDLVLTAIMSALAALASYRGVFLILGFVLLFVIDRTNGTLFRRIRTASAYGSFALFPLALWLIRNYAVSGSFTGRTLGPADLDPSVLIEFIRAALQSVWYVGGGPWQRGFVLAGVIVVAIRYHRILQKRRESQRQLLPLYVLAGSYLFFLGLSIVAVDSTLRFDDRLSLPALLLVFIIVSYYLRYIREDIQRFIGASAFGRSAAVVLLLLTGSGCLLFIHTQQLKQQQQSKDVERIRSLPFVDSASRIYSNAPDYLWFSVRRPVSFLPRRLDPASGKANAVYEDEKESFLRDLRKGAIVVYIGGEERQYLMPLDEFSAIPGLALRYYDGAVGIWSSDKTTL